MGKLFISESEKKRIRLLYERDTTNIVPSEFVKDISSQLGISIDLAKALDWSLYKNDKEKQTQLSNLFSSLKSPINDAVNKIRSDENRKNKVLTFIRQYLRANLTKEQGMFLDDLKKKLEAPQQTTTQPQSNQNTTTNTNTETTNTNTETTNTNRQLYDGDPLAYFTQNATLSSYKK